MRMLLAVLAALAAFVTYGAVSSGRRDTDSLAIVETKETVVPESLVVAAPESLTVPTGPVAEGFTVDQMVTNIVAHKQRPSIVIIYGTQCSLTREMFAEFAALARRYPDVDVLAFAADDENAADVPAFLREYGATFAPRYLHARPVGALTLAMAPLGIEMGTPYTMPFVAVRDASGRVITQGEAMTDLSSVEQAISRLR